MRRLPWKLLCLSIWGLSASACSTLDEVRPNVCGNLAIDSNEDCDGSSPFPDDYTASNDEDDDKTNDKKTACGQPNTENGCYLIHDEEEGIFCPVGWGSGEDGRCRLPSGTFEKGPESPFRFPVDSFGVGDVDGDGVADLIGNSSRTITVRYGSTDGSFVDELEVFTREATGPLTFQDINDDKRLDVLVPIAGGIFTLLGTEDRDLEPVAYSPIEAGEVEVALIPLPSHNTLNIVTPVAVLGSEGGLSAVAFPEQSNASELLVSQGADKIAGRVPVGLLNRALSVDALSSGGILEAGRYSFVLAFEGDTEVNVYSTTGNVGAKNLEVVNTQTISLPFGSTVGPRGALLAFVDNDIQLDLIVSAAHLVDGVLREDISVSKNLGAGILEENLTPASIRIFNENSTPDTWKKVPFPLAMADVSGDGLADYITPKGIFTTSIGGFPAGDGNVFRTGSVPNGENWRSATLADYNSDGALDVATSSEDEDALFVFLGHGTGLFNKFTVTTEFPPKMLRSGDFDGDLISDIAFVESPTDEDEADEVSVSFGSRTGSTSFPVFMGSLGHIEVFEPAVVANSSGTDAIPDLLVASQFTNKDNSVRRSVAFLEGSSARRMVSPLALPSNGNDDGVDIPVQIVAGSFAGIIDEHSDLLIVTVEELDDEDDTNAEHRLYTLKGLGEGQFEVTNSGTEATEENQFSDSLIAATGFNAECALWAVGDLHQVTSLSGDLAAESATIGSDELIGFDGVVRPGRCSQERSAGQNVVVSNTSQEDQPLELISTDVADTNLIYHSIAEVELFDADLDRDSDLVVVYKGAESDMSTEENFDVDGDGVVVYWNEGGTFVKSSSLDGSNLKIRSAAPVLLEGDDLVPELLVLAQDGLFISRLSKETGSSTFSDLEPFLGAEKTAGYERFEVGDLNGDGLTDLALVFGKQVDILLAVPKAPRGSILALPETGNAQEGDIGQ